MQGPLAESMAASGAGTIETNSARNKWCRLQPFRHWSDSPLYQSHRVAAG
jgi:hypothetical protein